MKKRVPALLLAVLLALSLSVPALGAPAEETSPSPEVTEEPVSSPEATVEPSSSPDVTEEPVPSPEDTEEPSPSPEATEEPSPSPDATEEPVSSPDVTEEPAPSPEAEPVDAMSLDLPAEASLEASLVTVTFQLGGVSGGENVSIQRQNGSGDVPLGTPVQVYTNETLLVGTRDPDLRVKDGDGYTATFRDGTSYTAQLDLGSSADTVTLLLSHTYIDLHITGEAAEKIEICKHSRIIGGPAYPESVCHNGDRVTFYGTEMESENPDNVYLWYRLTTSDCIIRSVNGAQYTGYTSEAGTWTTLAVPKTLFDDESPSLAVEVGRRETVTLKISPSAWAGHVHITNEDGQTVTDGSAVYRDEHLKATFDTGYTLGSSYELEGENGGYDWTGETYDWVSYGYWDIHVRSFDDDSEVTLPVVRSVTVHIEDPLGIIDASRHHPDSSGVFSTTPDAVLTFYLAAGYELQVENGVVLEHGHIFELDDRDDPLLGPDGSPLVGCYYNIRYDADQDNGSMEVTISPVARTHEVKTVKVQYVAGSGVREDELEDILSATGVSTTRWVFLDTIEFADSAGNDESVDVGTVALTREYAPRAVKGCRIGPATEVAVGLYYTLFVEPGADEVVIEIFKLTDHASLTVKDGENAGQIVSVDSGPYMSGMAVGDTCTVKVKNGYAITGVQGGSIRGSQTVREADGGIYTVYSVAAERENVVISVEEGTLWRWLTLRIDAPSLAAYQLSWGYDITEDKAEGNVRICHMLLGDEPLYLLVREGFTLSLQGGTVIGYSYGAGYNSQATDANVRIRVDGDVLEMKLVRGRFKLAAKVSSPVQSISAAEGQLTSTLANAASDITAGSTQVKGLTGADGMKTAMAEGATITARMTAADTVPAVDKAALDNVIAGQTVDGGTEYMSVDISVEKRVLQDDGQEVTTPAIAVITEVVEPVQFAYPLEGEAAAAEYFLVLREHDGMIDELDCRRAADKLLFSSDKFSSFAVVYSQKEILDAPPSPDAESQPSPTSTNTGTGGQTAPATGDSTPLALYAVLLALGLAGLGLVLGRKKKSGN